MNEKQVKELMKVHENNQVLEATFFEIQEGLSIVAKQTRHLYEECIHAGFDESQSLEIAIRYIGGAAK